MRHKQSYGTKLLVIGLAGILFTVTMLNNSGYSQKQEPPRPEAYLKDLSVDPPNVESATVRLIEKATSAGNALLKVRFVKGEQERLGRTVPLELEKDKVLLRDDGSEGDERAGDGVFSAVINFDLQEFEQQQQRLQEMDKNQERLVRPIFKGRERIAEERVQPFDVRRLRANQEISIVPFGLPMMINSAKSLMVIHPQVVQDPTRTFNPCTKVGTPMGKWTFGYLMQQMANQPLTGVNPSTFVRKWLSKWEADQTINGWNVPKRLLIKNMVIDPWQAASGGPGKPLDLAKAPFKLVAIVNRVDLRTNTVYGGGNAGEGRFVFGVMTPNCQMLRFTVIFEYGVPLSGCLAVRNWAKRWVNLGTLPLGSPAYNAALENITEVFAKANANPSKPNRSALNQLRTNENALNPLWELREFQIGQVSHHLDEVTVKQSPDFSLNGTPTMANWVNINAALIVNDKHTVPVSFPGATHFLGGNSPTPFGAHWNSAAIPNRNARFHFSLNTCNGCHAGETNTTFLHVNPASMPAGLSGFLTGINVPDRADGAPIHHFDDLQRRAADLDSLANSLCIFQLFFEPLRMVH